MTTEHMFKITALGIRYTVLGLGVGYLAAMAEFTMPEQIIIMFLAIWTAP